VTPKPTEVIRTSTFHSPDVNRSTDFLPCETKYDNKFSRCLKIILFCNVADIWRVVLKGESKDYIHTSFVNVTDMYNWYLRAGGYMISICHKGFSLA